MIPARVDRATVAILCGVAFCAVVMAMVLDKALSEGSLAVGP